MDVQGTPSHIRLCEIDWVRNRALIALRYRGCKLCARLQWVPMSELRVWGVELVRRPDPDEVLQRLMEMVHDYQTD